jgi:hypothetical protein
MPAGLRAYGYRSPFSHANENAAPASYNVSLPDFDVALTVCDTHTGIHLYQPTGAHATEPYSVVIDLAHSINVGAVVAASAQIQRLPDGSVEVRLVSVRRLWPWPEGPGREREDCSPTAAL